MWDEEKTVFAPERNISYFSLSPCVDKSRQDKVHFIRIQATADFHSQGNLDTEPQHDTRTRKSIKKQTGKGVTLTCFSMWHTWSNVDIIALTF